MKASELNDIIEQRIAEYGDLEIMTSYDAGELEIIEDIEILHPDETKYDIKGPIFIV